MSRLDAELVARGIAQSRERAKEMIKSGGIIVNGKTASKPSLEVSAGDAVEALTEDLQYVGRGALKLEKAAAEFGIDFTGKLCLDIGASTGGFTDFMLKNGAARVIAVDVGHGQLAESLKADSRVVNAEGTDIRDVTAEFTGGEVDFISVDVSFISLKKILPKMYELLKNGACAAVLIKPQFEAGRENIGKRGIVKDRRVHERILSDINAFAAELGFYAEKYTYSPVKGGSGNIEYLVKLVKSELPAKLHDFSELTDRAFKQL
ncbi:MAG: TlyA family RNA methyltransferase [Ruminococcus sp.]|nr:TlyA family RNA methyltransferase [Ruminococcus sp.]MBQ8298032.1 TlyA family RNA methyltransferase [Ruminococcus sp.]